MYPIDFIMKIENNIQYSVSQNSLTLQRCGYDMSIIGIFEWDESAFFGVYTFTCQNTIYYRLSWDVCFPYLLSCRVHSSCK